MPPSDLVPQFSSSQAGLVEAWNASAKLLAPAPPRPGHAQLDAARLSRAWTVRESSTEQILATMLEVDRRVTLADGRTTMLRGLTGLSTVHSHTRRGIATSLVGRVVEDAVRASNTGAVAAWSGHGGIFAQAGFSATASLRRVTVRAATEPSGWSVEEVSLAEHKARRDAMAFTLVRTAEDWSLRLSDFGWGQESVRFWRISADNEQSRSIAVAQSRAAEVAQLHDVVAPSSMRASLVLHALSALVVAVGMDVGRRHLAASDKTWHRIRQHRTADFDAASISQLWLKPLQPDGEGLMSPPQFMNLDYF
ncbi:hypothetical protein ACIP98_38215 [Streptomyces sp. NPDC088354]|uniref:hypothetical protein n=1 Tax=Streptomyces sp. NPDC088354 TaxID=3365856 RepID=UPI0038238AEC